MHLYALTLQKPSSVTQAVHGNFSGSKQQEIIVARGRVLEILKPDPNTGKLHSIYAVDTFSLVRSILPFKLTGSSKGMYVFVMKYLWCESVTSVCFCVKIIW